MLGNHLLIPQPLEHRKAFHCSLPFVNSTGATDGLRSTFHCDPKATVRHSPRKPKFTLRGDVEAEKFLYGCPFFVFGSTWKNINLFLALSSYGSSWVDWNPLRQTSRGNSWLFPYATHSRTGIHCGLFTFLPYPKCDTTTTRKSTTAVVCVHTLIK